MEEFQSSFWKEFVRRVDQEIMFDYVSSKGRTSDYRNCSRQRKPEGRGARGSIP